MKGFLFIPTFLLSLGLHAQTVENIDQHYLGAWGIFGRTDSMHISATIGEPATISYTGSETSFTQGFQQPVFIDSSYSPPPECDKIYNVITPFGSPGANDYWDIGSLAEDSEVNIYDRWGRTVFQAKPYLNNWEGQDRDQQFVQPGTYYYWLRFDGKECRGTITVMK